MWFVKLLFTVIFIFGIFFDSLNASSTDLPTEYLIPITISNSGQTNTRTIIFGGNKDATYCIDNVLGEYELPPQPPSDAFDVRFLDSRVGNNACMGNGLERDLRPWLTIVTSDTFRIRFQAGVAGYPIEITWPSNLSEYFISASMRVFSTTIDMLTSNNIVINDEDINSVRIITTVKPMGGVPVLPQIPVLIAPTNNSMSTSTSQTLRWNLINEAISYNIQMSNDTNFTNLLLNEVVTTNYYFIEYLKIGRSYYWRVKANYHGVSSEFSRFWNFKLCFQRPSGPVRNISPAYNSSDLPSTITFRWTSVADAAGYVFRIWETDYLGWDWRMIIDMIVDTNFITIHNLKKDSKFIWGVYPFNDCGTYWVWDHWPFQTETGNSYFTFSQVDYAAKSNKIVWWAGNYNAGNIIDEAITRNAWPAGITFGVIPRADSLKNYGWAHLKVTKKRNWKRILPHTESARGFDLWGNIRWRGKRNFPNLKYHNNHLLGELLALKINIKISDLGITQQGFGELIYSDSISPSSVCNGKTIRHISKLADTALTYLAFKYDKYWMFQDLDSVISRINRAFQGPVELATVNPLRLRSSRSIEDVPFLRINPAGSSYAGETELENTETETPHDYALLQNYPNPFNPYTSIEFHLKEVAYVTIQVYNTLGQQVALLTNREIYDKGRHEIIFEAGNLPSGVYFYRMVIENLDDNLKQQTFMKKMLLLK